MLTKTLNVPSSMVAERMKSCEVVLWALVTFGRQMVDVLVERFSSHLGEGQVMPFATELELFKKRIVAADETPGWFEESLDLSPLGGKTVRFTFAAVPEQSRKLLSPHVVWAAPTIVLLERKLRLCMRPPPSDRLERIRSVKCVPGGIGCRRARDAPRQADRARNAAPV